jgi:hypothetical protein
MGEIVIRTVEDGIILTLTFADRLAADITLLYDAARAFEVDRSDRPSSFSYPTCYITRRILSRTNFVMAKFAQANGWKDPEFPP